MPIVLVIIGIVLIIYNYRAIKNEENSLIQNNPSNSSFENILKENKDDLSEYRMELGILRRDIAESLTELQEEIIEIKNNINILKNNEEVYENKDNVENYKNEYVKANDSNLEESNVNLDIDNGVISEIKFSDNIQNINSTKTESIKKLLLDGLTEEEICCELSISKGEVLLVKGLFKK